MPNTSATCVFTLFAETIINRKNIYLNFKPASVISDLILVFTIISEIIHDKFLNSPFYIYDIIATIVSIIIYLIFFYFHKD